MLVLVVCGVPRSGETPGDAERYRRCTGDAPHERLWKNGIFRIPCESHPSSSKVNKRIDVAVQQSSFSVLPAQLSMLT